MVRLVSVLSLLLSACSVAYCVIVLAESSSTAATMPFEEVHKAEIEAKVQILASQVKSLEEKVSSVHASRFEVDGQSQLEATDDVIEAAISSLTEEIAVLREEIDADQFQPGDGRAPEYSGKSREVVESQLSADAVNAYQSVFIDVSSTIEDRLAALRMLRRFPKEHQARNEAVVSAALDMLSSSSDSNVRDEIIDGLKDHDNERLVEPLINILQDDEDQGTRREAAQALRSFLYRSDVVDVLSVAANRDPSSRIRRHIAAMLEDWEEDSPD